MDTPDERAPLLELRDVVKVYGSGEAATAALRGVTLSVGAGELVAVMGPSGSGKSTLLHTAVGLEAPDAGSVVVDGAVVDPSDRTRWEQLRRRRIGVLYQRLNLIPSLSAVANVEVPVLLDGGGRAAARRAGAAALEGVGLHGLGGRRPDELSGGERVLVGLARAIVGGRSLVLADEPTGALDSVAGERVLDVLATQTARGVGVLMVTHDARVASWADRIVMLRDGTVQPGSASHPSTSAVAVTT